MGECSIYAVFERVSKTHAQKTALVFNDSRTTYEDLFHKVGRLADALEGCGVSQASVVGMVLPNGLAFVECFYATQKLGAVAVPLNTKLTPNELKACIDVARCDCVVFDAGYREALEAAREDFGVDKGWVCLNADASIAECVLSAALTGSEARRTEAAGLAEPLEEALPSAEDKTALIVCTSGTTGLPKAVVHTKAGMFMRFVVSALSANPVLEADVFCCYAHLSHLSGLGRLISLLSVGATMVLVDRVSASALLGLIAQERPNCLQLLPPSFIYRIKEENEPLNIDLSCVTRIETGSTILFPQTIEEMFAQFPNARIAIGYGQSECYPITNFCFSRQEYAASPHLINSCGKAAAYTQIRIVGEDGRDIEPGEFGEALVDSPARMRGYQGERPLEGWLSTGDYLTVDEQGFYYFVDRKNDVIKSGAEYVTTVEVERHILKHEAVTQCAVIGHVTSRRGEIVVAFVVLKPGSDVREADVIAFCKGELAFFKVPQRVVFIDGLPQTSTGKTDKKALRSQLVEETKRKATANTDKIQER
jgi:long-chain acyl-CoA synthetase